MAASTCAVERLQQVFLYEGKRKILKPGSEPDNFKSIYHAPFVMNQAVQELKKEVNPENLAAYSDPVKFIEQLEDHLDRRIQLFFQQAILCFDTPFYYESEGAEDQIGQGATIPIDSKTKIRTHGAHPGTLPCLIAYTKDDQGKVKTASKFVYLRLAYAYNCQNATDEVPDFVNKLDSLIDGKTDEPKLRKYTLELINEIAQAKLDPTAATRLFVKKLEERLVSIEKDLKETDPRKIVTKVYLNHLDQIKNNIQHSDNIFDIFMGVKIKGSKDEEILRDIVYKKRFSLIQYSQAIESQVMKRITAVEGKIFGTRNTTATYVDNRFRYFLLNNAEHPQKRTLERLFGTSAEQLEFAEAENEKKLRSVQNTLKSFEEIKKQHQSELTELDKDLNNLFDKLIEEELAFRSKLLRDLRWTYKNKWSQEKLAKNYKALFPNDSMSASMVYRFEYHAQDHRKTEYDTPLNQRKKDIDIDRARKIAKTLDIDSGLFVFTSDF